MAHRLSHREVIKQVARRFPDLTQRQIAEVLEVLVEVWRAALAQSDDVMIRDFGRLTVEVQRMKNSGAIRAHMGSGAPDSLTRLYFRFRPTPGLRADIEHLMKEGR
jgi:nucleoid DNA-binding protein